MSPGVVFSILINVAVAVYFIHFFPRSIRKKIPQQRMPPFFAVLLKIIPLLGYLLLIGTLLYMVLGVE